MLAVTKRDGNLLLIPLKRIWYIESPSVDNVSTIIHMNDRDNTQLFVSTPYQEILQQVTALDY